MAVKSHFNLVFILLFTHLTCLQAQVRMESLTVADGLSQGFITSFIQDEKGFIWMGTYDGLNRYDGYSIRHFKPKPFDSLSIQASYITSLYEDRQHFIWVGTSNGLFLFDPVKEHFFRLSGASYGLPAYFISQITGDGDGNIFVQISLDSDPLGLFRIRLPRHFLQCLSSDKDPLSKIEIQRIADTDPLEGEPLLLECIGDTMVLLRDDNARILRYDYTRNRLARFDLSALPRSNTADHSILWGKTKGYIYRTRLPDGRDYMLPLKRWVMALRMEGGRVGVWFYAGNSLFRLVDDKPVTCRLDLPQDAIFRQEGFQKEFETILATEKPERIEMSLWNNNLLADRGGVIWIGTGGWGVRKINPRQISFDKFLTGQSISSLRELPDGRLWIRLYNDHTLTLNLATGQTISTLEAPLGDAWFYELYISRKKDYWRIKPFTTPYDYKRLSLYEAETGRIIQFNEQIPFLEGVPEKITEDRDGNIWIGAHKGLLYRCRPGQHRLDSFSYASFIPGENQLNLRTTTVVQDPRGILWIGTNKGLVRAQNINLANPKFQLFTHDPKNPKSISMDWVSCICPDPHNPDVYWLGTRGGGLNRLDIPSLTFSFWTESPNGFPDNVVYGILPDDTGNLWCSTNRGICRFSPRENTFITYQESDGLASTEFNTNSFLRTSDGSFCFGGVSGLTVFRPADIYRQKTPPPVAITGIKVRGVLRYPDQEGLLSLPFEENNVLFEYATLDFANPATNRFRHRLKGIDRDWVYDGTMHNANYSVLPPANYVFELQGATADSPWSERTVTFNLIIRAPWYRSWLAYFICFLLAAAAMFGYIRYREEVFKLQNKATLNQRESERLKAFEALKNQFFADVAHELRTPLTVILGLADRLRRGVKKDAVPEHAHLIIEQGDQLLQLTNQVLDLARLESNQFQLHLLKGNLVEFIKTHAAALIPLAASKGIHLSANTDLAELWIDFDQSQLRKILNNLVSNAIRHTPPGGDIQVNTTMDINSQMVHISVSDTGEGIPADEIPRIFDRFYQGHKANSGVGASGIGLTLSRDLVQLMGGRITVESKQGKGSTFSIVLPVKIQTPEAVMPGDKTFDTSTQTDQPAPVSDGKMPLLLVLEDNQDVWGFLRLCLQPHFRLVHADNGVNGIEKAFELIPDLILTDVAMPLKDGYEVTSVLKNDQRTSHIPIAMLTAKVESKDRMEGHRRGANAYLTKPFEEAELLLVLKNLLHLRQQWQLRYAHFPEGHNQTGESDLCEQDAALEDIFMQQLNEIFERNYIEETFNLDRLCRLLNMSSSQLDRKLKVLTNQSPMQMLRTFRLQKARNLLRSTPNISIKEVCFRTGFKNPSHFSRLYSKEFGAPPSAG